MKKLISAIILTLILIQSINMQCLAQCEIPSASVKGLNLDSKILEENGFFEKELDDKFVNVTAINRIGKFVSDLENKLTDSYKKIVTSWNSNLNEKTIDIIGSSVKDIFSGKYGTENADALIKGLEYLKGISTDVKLSDEEKIKAVEEGRIRSEIGMASSVGTAMVGGGITGMIAGASGLAGTAGSALGTASGVLTGATVEAIGEGMATFILNAYKTANIVESIGATEKIIFWSKVAENAGTVATTVGTTVASVLTPVLIVGAAAVGVYGTYKIANLIYNKYFSEKPYNEAVFESLKTGNLLIDITKSVCEHEWIGNNVLTVATSKDQNCDKTFANFEKMKGINYNKTKEEINNDFAALECKLLGYPNDEDCKKEALNSINCHWENVYDTSKCSLNPYYKYYKKIVEDLAQNSANKKTDKEEL